LFIPLPLAVLAQPHFEEEQEQAAAEAGRDEADQEQLARQSADQHAACRAGHYEHAG
jgi:hypothetical protein